MHVLISDGYHVCLCASHTSTEDKNTFLNTYNIYFSAIYSNKIH